MKSRYQKLRMKLRSPNVIFKYYASWLPFKFPVWPDSSVWSQKRLKLKFKNVAAGRIPGTQIYFLRALDLDLINLCTKCAKANSVGYYVAVSCSVIGIMKVY